MYSSGIMFLMHEYIFIYFGKYSSGIIFLRHEYIFILRNTIVVLCY